MMGLLKVEFKFSFLYFPPHLRFHISLLLRDMISFNEILNSSFTNLRRLSLLKL